MTPERTLDRLIAHLRGQVAELRRMEVQGAAPEEVAMMETIDAPIAMGNPV